MYKVFLADDEMWISLTLKKLIDRSGLPFQVIGEANNGVTALEEIEDKKPDVLFTDIRMPGLNGLELLQQINEKNLSVNVVLISGYAEFGYAQSALRLGVFDYLLKPVEQKHLNAVLMRLLTDMQNENGNTEAEQPEELINPTMMKRIIKEIKQNYTHNVTLSGLSEKYGISIGYLSSQLKSELGLSFSEYITSKRIQKAKELLADENLSIDAITELTGYNDYFYFTKVFKKTTGISPSKYRKNMNKTEEVRQYN